MAKGKTKSTAKTVLERIPFAPWTKDLPLVAVVSLSGAIGMSTPLRPSLSIAAVAAILDRAFTMRNVKAVAISVNSPGGSPVQSALIYKRIRALSEENEVPVYIFVEDVAASGGYLIALAGDEIIADQNSIIGSIGVISTSFGFDRAIEKLGIDRRVYTSGARKMTLDPFQPEKPDDVRRLKAVQKDVHQTFIDLVKERRGSALQAPDRTLFSGEFWSGAKGLELGLVDRIGDLRSEMRGRFGEDVILKIIPRERSLWPFRRQATGSLMSPPLIAPENWISALEERAIWSRYGL
ncbi:MAG: S49 family peptidase [Hyphomicrobiales bacterium]|nr:S49 family peptidase [Hyphomicrobiales bacterium]